MTETVTRPKYEPKVDHMPIEAVDHIEIWCGNALQASYFYEHALGFTPIAYAGLETGQRGHTSRVLAQGEVRLVFTGTLGAEGPIADFVHKHGDGVKRVALRV